MIKNVVFDMGQVLIHWCPDVLIDRYDLTKEEKAQLKRELFGNVEWIQLDHGTISFDEAVDRICCRLPEKLHRPADEIVRGWWHRELIPMEGMAQLVGDLKAAGRGIYLLSNASVNLRDFFFRVPGSEYFDGLMVSAEEKLLKPQHEIYEQLYARFCLKPEECIFIDDNPANVEGAICTGMDGIVFRGDTEALRRELRERGIQ